MLSRVEDGGGMDALGLVIVGMCILEIMLVGWKPNQHGGKNRCWVVDSRWPLFEVHATTQINNLLLVEKRCLSASASASVRLLVPPQLETCPHSSTDLQQHQTTASPKHTQPAVGRRPQRARSA